MNNREIKFRVWEKSTNFMWTEEGSTLDDRYDKENFGSLPEVFLWALRGLRDGDKPWTVAGDHILQEYIGIKDKNNKEIYEGDILTGHMGYSPDVKLTGVVEFSTETLGYGLRFNPNPNTKDSLTEDLFLVHGLEVIGNIYENTDLVEKYNLT